MRVKYAKKAPSRELLRELHLKANARVQPHTTTHNGARFLIASKGVRISLNDAIDAQLPDAEKALRAEQRVVVLS